MSCAFLPASCSLCGSPLPHLSSAPICDVCWSETPLEPGPVCALCGDSLLSSSAPTTSDAGFCRACRLAPPPFRRAVAYGTYDGRLRDLLHALKYGGLRPAASELGHRLAMGICQLAPEIPQELTVIPVPLHRSKQADRGFNQANLLAAEAVRALRATHPEWRLTLTVHVLVRTRATDSQAGLTPGQRRRNLNRAFEVRHAKSIAGKDVLLIDDILTTGATARAASKALLDAGAASVWVATLARARRNLADSVAFYDAHRTQHVPALMPGLNPQLASQQHASLG